MEPSAHPPPPPEKGSSTGTPKNQSGNFQGFNEKGGGGQLGQGGSEGEGDTYVGSG